MSLRWQAQVFLYLMEAFEASSCASFARIAASTRCSSRRGPSAVVRAYSGRRRSPRSQASIVGLASTLSPASYCANAASYSCKK